MTPENYIKAELAGLCWREGAHIGGLEILLALGCVMRNRVNAGWRGGDWLEVVASAEEYTSECGSAEVRKCEIDAEDGVIVVSKGNGECAHLVPPCSLAVVLEYAEIKPVRPDLREPLARMFLQQVDDIFSGMLEDRWTEGALFYGELHRISREWFRREIVGKPEDHARVATVGGMTFFR